MTQFRKLIQILDPATLPGALAIAGILFALGLFLSWAIRRLTIAALHHDERDLIDAISLKFISRLIGLVVWLLLLTVYAHLIPALDRLANAMLAGVGLASVIIGFAAQQTLGNLVAGISLVLYRPFRQGDRLQIATPTESFCDTGLVEGVSLGFTTLRADDGREIIVANGTMAQQTMIKLPRNAPDASAPSAKDKAPSA
ncbi:mechanosensitive ion channel [Paracoccus aurantiacus]|uniref:Small-conductance mechanosensitive channel n=1 Tax=Paracoccus aurantiacus TaxID=2599412 RepID=A0A5C6S8G2_9RHOB|nr:mechanosensitive ion channel domain-containing protein [Paracoccus aurantiacus]TXB70807.1 mechanosensitive ion channel [Paracoccus aurantiacus]